MPMWHFCFEASMINFFLWFCLLLCKSTSQVRFENIFLRKRLEILARTLTFLTRFNPVTARALLPLRFSPIPSILMPNDPVRNEPPALPCIKSLEPCKSGKPIAELQRESGLTHVITLASNENPPGAYPRTLTCPAWTCS
jgi:hypothetical protein